MGSILAKHAAKIGQVCVFDIAGQKSKEIALRYGVNFSEQMEEALEADIVFLAIPKDEAVSVINNFSRNGCQLWVNFSTLLTKRNIRTLFPYTKNLVSVKIIGEADAINRGIPPVFVIDPDFRTLVNNDVLSLLKEIGAVIFDCEEKYEMVNYLAAELAMLAATQLAKKLKKKGIAAAAIEAAIKGVFVGTVSQFPYDEPDYFHQLVFAKHANLVNHLKEVKSN